jgi:Zn-finger nucleic acid-binding protein
MEFWRSRALTPGDTAHRGCGGSPGELIAVEIDFGPDCRSLWLDRRERRAILDHAAEGDVRRPQREPDSGQAFSDNRHRAAVPSMR